MRPAGGTAGVNTLTAAFTMTDSAAAETLVITGTESLTFGGAVTANAINATAFEHPMIMSAISLPAGGVTITGGGAADTLWGSAGADIINAGAGADTILAGDGADIVNGGAGIDTFRFSLLTDGGLADAGTTVGADVLGDFTVGTGGDVIALSGAVFQDPDDGGATAATIGLQTVTCAANGTSVVGLTDPGAGATLPIVVCTTTLTNWTAVETFCDTTIAATFGAANDGAITIVNVTDIGQLIVWDPDSDTDNDLLVLGQFSPTITLGSLVAANFDEYVN